MGWGLPFFAIMEASVVAGREITTIRRLKGERGLREDFGRGGSRWGP